MIDLNLLSEDSLEIMVKEGIGAPVDIINGFFLSNTDKERILIETNKNKVLEFIKKQDNVYLSDIRKYFKLDIAETKQILNQLEKEGKIKIK